ncbi:DUF1573 domain-containing protein [Candidatus Uhrbacteria bacterium]|nr:DUF1573 domain-containing protein [Candidatus Uhrbacteria bacterium]
MYTRQKTAPPDTLSRYIRQHRNTFTVIGVAVVAFGVLVWISRPDGTTPAAQGTTGGAGALTVTGQSYDFGTISMAKGKVTYAFPLKNESAGSVTVKKLSTSCMCTTATLVHGSKRRGPYGMPGHRPIPRIDEVIAAGEDAVIEVTFDPAAHGPSGVGRIARVVTAETSAGPVELRIAATVTP